MTYAAHIEKTILRRMARWSAGFGSMGSTDPDLNLQQGYFLGRIAMIEKETEKRNNNEIPHLFIQKKNMKKYETDHN